MNENILAKVADFLKDLLTPKKNVGDDTSYMSGKRGADLMSGKSTPSGWYEAFLLEKYAKDTTPVGDPRRVQFSAENNLKRIINWTPLIILIAVLLPVYFFGLPMYQRYKYRCEVLDKMPILEAPKSDRVIRSKFSCARSRLRTDPTLVTDFSHSEYRILSGEDLIEDYYDGVRKPNFILQVRTGGIDVIDANDENFVIKCIYKTDGKNFYTFDGVDSVWHRAYLPDGNVPRRPLFNDECYVLIGTNIIVRWE